MPLSVFAADEQSVHPIETLRWIKLAEAVLAEEGIRGETEVSILFVDEQSIADLNSRFLGREGPTDVLAFPIDEEPIESGRSPDSPTLLGDVVICPAVAYKNAPEHAGTFDDELALLLVHGLLHLLGMDHEDPDEAEIMEAKERVLLARHYAQPGAQPPDRQLEVGQPEGGRAPEGSASDGLEGRGEPLQEDPG